MKAEMGAGEKQKSLVNDQKPLHIISLIPSQLEQFLRFAAICAFRHT
jgi:hypothetical protein